MEAEEENMLVNSKRIIKKKVPEDYDPHQIDRKGVGRGKNRKGKVMQVTREADFKCDNCGAANFLKGNHQIRKCRHIFDTETS